MLPQVLFTPNARELTNTTTHEEAVFAEALIKAIAAEGMNLELFRNVFLGRKGSILRPDIYIPAAGLVIEVNGSSHYTPAGMSKDDWRLRNYTKLRLNVMQITNQDVADHFTRTRLISEILTILRNNLLSEGERNKIRVLVYQGRKSVEHLLQGDTGCITQARIIPEGALKGFKEIPAFGGSKFIFRKKWVGRKYKARQNKEVPNA